ncbi:transmembrane protein 176 isoform X2 [Pseudochaenichthys georgianus]
MAVAVCRDMTVTVLEDVNAAKLMERQQALRAAIQRGEPKCLGVSQVMLGLMVVSYSIPLLFTDVTEVVLLGVPWWSGLTFITAGVVTIVLDKHCTMKILRVCLVVTIVSTLLSVVALIIYSVDMGKNPAVPCVKNPDGVCSDQYHATVAHPKEEEPTGHHRLVEHLQQPRAEGPEPPQEEQLALPLPEESFGVVTPVQFIVEVHSQELVALHRLHLHLLPDGDGGQRPLAAPPEVNHQLLSLADVELEVIVVTPAYEVLHQGPVLILVVICDAADDGGVIGEPL